jgi:hypothetical protein
MTGLGVIQAPIIFSVLSKASIVILLKDIDATEGKISFFHLTPEFV